MKAFSTLNFSTLSKGLTGLLTGLAITFAAATTHAQVIQFDFGNNADVYAGTNAPAGISASTWNGIGTGGGVNSGLLYGDGTAATGVEIDLGRSDGGSLIDWDVDLTDVRNNVSLTPDATIYDTSLTQSWFFGRSNQNLGVRVSGLAPGEYDVYSINREPNEFGRTYDVGIGLEDTTDITALATTSLTAFTATDPAATDWVDGQNFATERVTVTDTSDYITVIVDPTNAAFSTISGLQIVAVSTVPEPSSLVIMLSLGFAGLTRRKRS